jgi:plasmid stabilization system protein ParE
MVKTTSFTIVWDKKALSGFKDILEYLSTRSEQAPKIIKNGVLNKIEIISKNPYICELDRLKNKPNNDFRAFIIYSYRITYQIKETRKEIRILRIRHTSMEPLGY